jgi:hypothetical protein
MHQWDMSMVTRALHHLEGSYQRWAIADDPGPFLDRGHAVLVFRHHPKSAEVELSLLCAWDTSQQPQDLSIPACCGNWVLQGEVTVMLSLQNAHVRGERQMSHSVFNHLLGILHPHAIIVPAHVE